MNRIKLFFIFMAYTSSIFAYEKLNSYDAIKNALLNGKNVRVIIDSRHDCIERNNPKIKLVSGGSSSIVGISFNLFAIDDDTAAIQTQVKVINPAEKGPFGFAADSFPKGAAYSMAEIAVYPDNSIHLDSVIITLPEYKTPKAWHFNCKMSTGDNYPGAKFFSN